MLDTDHAVPLAVPGPARSPVVSKLVEVLTSRKLWMTIAAAIPLILNRDWVMLAQLVSVYVGVQGAVDVASKLRQSPPPRPLA